MSAQGMDSTFLSILGEFLDGYSKCAIMAGTTAEQFKMSLGTLIKVCTCQPCHEHSRASDRNTHAYRILTSRTLKFLAVVANRSRVQTHVAENRTRRCNDRREVEGCLEGENGDLCMIPVSKMYLWFRV